MIISLAVISIRGLDNILSSELREQAGANSYNRFDYQVHWIVYHMIKEFKKGNEF